LATGGSEAALLNLLLNAVEALDREEGQVTTGSRGGAPVRIGTTGAASRRRTAQIFRLFFTTRKNGSGLGLPIVRQIAHQHGGTVSVRSREGVGTAVTVSLPFEAQFRAMFPGRLPLALPPGADGETG
jgi:signal transduction histidine kinase